MTPGPPPGNKQDGTGGLEFDDTTHALPDVIQTRGASSYTVELYGSAVRVGYGIPAPRLLSVLGKTAVEIDDASSTGAVSHADVDGSPVPIFASEWHKLYYLTDAPLGEIGPPNSFVAGGGDTDDSQLVWL